MEKNLYEYEGKYFMVLHSMADQIDFNPTCVGRSLNEAKFRTGIENPRVFKFAKGEKEENDKSRKAIIQEWMEYQCSHHYIPQFVVREPDNMLTLQFFNCDIFSIEMALPIHRGIKLHTGCYEAMSKYYHEKMVNPNLPTIAPDHLNIMVTMSDKKGNILVYKYKLEMKEYYMYLKPGSGVLEVTALKKRGPLPAQQHTKFFGESENQDSTDRIPLTFSYDESNIKKTNSKGKKGKKGKRARK